MSVDESPSNPYHSGGAADDAPLAPFAGRQAAFSRLHQQLTDPPQREAMLFTGWQGMGKTALLRNFSALFDETYIGVYVPLKTTRFDSEVSWLLALVEGVNVALAQREFTLSRLPEPPSDEDTLRDWLADSYLPEVFTIIRPHRRLVFLLDDAERLLNAVTAETLPADSFAYLKALLEQHHQLGIVLTADASYEADLHALSPLVRVTDAFRLTNLAPDATEWLLREPVAGLYHVSDEAVNAVHRSTGGHPQLLQRFGYHLFEHWQARPEHNSIIAEDLKEVTRAVYQGSEAEFKQTWMTLSRDERLVLTAISSLLYANPLHALDTAAIETWLVETDYPTDATTINAALRSLDYRQLLSHKPTGVALTSGLLQTWLLENARLGDSRRGQGESLFAGRRGVLLLALLVAVVAVVLVFIALSSATGTTPAIPPQATVTLERE